MEINEIQPDGNPKNFYGKAPETIKEILAIHESLRKLEQLGRQSFAHNRLTMATAYFDEYLLQLKANGYAGIPHDLKPIFSADRRYQLLINC